MPDYSKGKIYKLTSSNSNDIYIGSTIQNLSKRKAHHIADYKKFIIEKKIYISSFKIIECGGIIDICLLEEYPCDNKEQLHQRERFYIENNCCVNKNIPNRQFNEYIKIWKEKNKDIIKHKLKEYRQKNTDILKQKRKEYVKLNNDTIKQNRKEYYELNKDIIKQKRKEYYELNKHSINERRSKKKNIL